MFLVIPFVMYLKFGEYLVALGETENLESWLSFEIFVILGAFWVDWGFEEFWKIFDFRRDFRFRRCCIWKLLTWVRLALVFWRTKEVSKF